MQPPRSADITGLLQRWSGGDKAALNDLSPLVYDELVRIARGAVRHERSGHTLQAKDIVHDAFEKLVDVEVTWQDRGHFYSLAARLMRRLLINHANGRLAQKRGGSKIAVTFSEDVLGPVDSDQKLIELNDAIQSLADVDERKAQLIDLQYFVGLSFKQMSEVTGLSSSTIDRELRLARLWLKQHLLEG